MFLYTVLSALAAVIAGILIAACTKKADNVTYGKLDKVSRITNIVLLVVYLLFSPVYLFLGMISTPLQDGFPGIGGGILSAIIASASLFCGLGLGFSVALRKKGKSKAGFIVQFAGIFGIGLAILLYAIFAGSLISPLN